MTSKGDQYARKAAGWSDDGYADTDSYLDHRAELIATLGVRLLPGDEVLDLACGDGGLGEHVLPRGLRYTGIDAEPEMVDAARRSAASSRRSSTSAPTTGSATAHLPSRSRSTGCSAPSC